MEGGREGGRERERERGRETQSLRHPRVAKTDLSYDWFPIFDTFATVLCVTKGLKYTCIARIALSSLRGSCAWKTRLTFTTCAQCAIC